MRRKEAIEVIKNNWHNSSSTMLREALETLIPELKESEDEKIRKELLNAFQESEDSLYMVLTPHRRESFIAWLEKQGEQKPAEWSVEDEDYLNTTIAYLQYAKKLQNWVKSLKGRVQPQNKWKESIATADLENSLCDMQDGFSDTSYEYRILGEAIEFIRCTESKPRWKPSEEQMNTLEQWLKDNQYKGDARYCYPIIDSLYQGLKKLREK